MINNNRLNWQPPHRPAPRRPRPDPFPPPTSLASLETSPPHEAVVRASPDNAETARISLSSGIDVGAFCRTFTSVWEAIPPFDRFGLLKYWAATDPERKHRIGRPTVPEPRPHLELVPDAELPEADAEWRDSGDRLLFRVSVLGDRERLRGAIAEVLAKVHRLATGAHGRLLVEIEEPFWEWEKLHPKATEKQRQRKWEPIEAEYTRRYQEEITAILQRWGMTNSAAAKDAGA